MKKFFYTLVLVIAITSCKSVEKMVEKGEYDKASECYNQSLKIKTKV